ncbi:hypothetical protein SEA_AMOK_32 [Gordonia phage Amok]|nr:hypothetical protein SEA_AMOK_32 [Gordonia phage Amok]
MNTTHRRPTANPMWDSIFVPCCQVNTRTHMLERRAQEAGCTTLAEYHAFRRANS